MLVSFQPILQQESNVRREEVQWCQEGNLSAKTYTQLHPPRSYMQWLRFPWSFLAPEAEANDAMRCVQSRGA